MGQTFPKPERIFMERERERGRGRVVGREGESVRGRERRISIFSLKTRKSIYSKVDKKPIR